MYKTCTVTPSKPITSFKYHMEASTQVSENDSNIKFDEIFKKNTEKLKHQLGVCKLIYCMIKNMNCFAISDEDKLNKLKLILFKHLLRNIRELEDRKNNNFDLKLW